MEASGLHHSNGMGALDFAMSHFASHTDVHPLTQFASNEASHVFLMSQSKLLGQEDTHPTILILVSTYRGSIDTLTHLSYLLVMAATLTKS